MWRERIHEDEQGIALIYALFGVVILAGLAVVFVSRAISEAQFTGIGRDKEAAVHIAEAGAEAFIAAINEEGDGVDGAGNPVFAERVLTRGTTPSGYAAPSDPFNADATDDYFVYDTSLLSTEDAEIQWVLDIAAANPGLIRSTRQGDAIGIRPVLQDESDAAMVLFGAGFVPSYDDWLAGDRRAQVRVVKLQIARDSFTPEQALLVGGNLKLGGNASITSPNCAGTAETCDANVHVNGNLDVTGSSHNIEGRVSTSGTITGTPSTTPSGRAFTGEEDVPLPTVTARAFYGRNIGDLNSDPGGQGMVAVDLCPAGVIKEPAAAPCTGAPVWTAGSTSTTYRGWKWRAPQNTWEASNLEAGLFYVYHADADVTGTAGSGARAVTIIVEGDPANPTRSGSLALAGNPTMVSAMPDVLFIADRDIKMKGTSGGGSTTPTQRYTGFIWATEQLDVSGTVELSGAIISGDLTDDHGLVTRTTAGVSGNMVLDYDNDLVIDISGIVTIQYWNELD